MRNERDVVDYYLFYATNNILGLKRMKEAMWRVDEAGEFDSPMLLIPSNSCCSQRSLSMRYSRDNCSLTLEDV